MNFSSAHPPYSLYPPLLTCRDLQYWGTFPTLTPVLIRLFAWRTKIMNTRRHYSRLPAPKDFPLQGVLAWIIFTMVLLGIHNVHYNTFLQCIHILISGYWPDPYGIRIANVRSARKYKVSAGFRYDRNLQIFCHSDTQRFTKGFYMFS